MVEHIIGIIFQYTSSTDIAAIIEALSAVMVMGSIMLIYSAKKLFRSEEIGNITTALLIALTSIFLIRILSVFDIHVFKIINVTFYRSILGLIITISLLYFSNLFFNFAKQYGFATKTKKDKSQQKIMKALEGKNG